MAWHDAMVICDLLLLTLEGKMTPRCVSSWTGYLRCSKQREERRDKPIE